LGEVNPAGPEVNRQEVFPQQIQAEQSIHGGVLRQGVGDHREAEAVLAQRAQPGQDHDRHDLDRAPGRHLDVSD